MRGSIDARVASTSRKLRDAERRGRALALRAPRLVVAARVLVSHPGVDHEQLGLRGQRDALERECPRVDEERRALVGEARGHLVHRPHRRAHEVVLRGVRDPGDLHVVDGEAEHRPQGAGERREQRGARRQAASERHRRLDPRVEAGDRCAPAAEDRGDALHVVEPQSAARLLAGAERELGAAVHVRRRDLDEPVVPRREFDARLLRDRRRQHVAAAMVGVFADQVHAPRRLAQDLRRAAKTTSKPFPLHRRRSAPSVDGAQETQHVPEASGQQLRDLRRAGRAVFTPVFTPVLLRSARSREDAVRATALVSAAIEGAVFTPAARGSRLGSRACGRRQPPQRGDDRRSDQNASTSLPDASSHAPSWGSPPVRRISDGSGSR